jgi:Zn-dependent metalloprotease
MKKIIAAVAILLLATAAFAAKGPAPAPANDGINILGMSNGVPTFVTGKLGTLSLSSARSKDDVVGQSARVLTENAALFQMVGTERFESVSTTRDGIGMTHAKFQQTLRGLPVVGAELVVHADGNGNVYAINGMFAPDRNLPRQPRMAGEAALLKASAQAGITEWKALAAPSLTYVVNGKGNAYLAWTTRAQYVDSTGAPQIDKLYADAGTGDLVQRAPEYKYLKNRKVYTANNGTTLPGTLLWSEGGTATSDTTAQAAYNYAGNVYDYYKTVHARDSYDNAGATIISSVHFSSSYNNAYWNGSQMVYGDGDGTTFIPLCKALDVDAHELTHAVTERTANLTYSNESGALNEAWSDIMGESVESYTRGVVDSNTWKVGEDIYTPGTAGDALRYMNNPTLDGSSKDWYPSRYTGTSDNGGVHSNSGIANLAYYLMVMGGTHPRSMSTVVVPAFNATARTSIGMAEKIFYRALTVYMTSSTNFQAARNATAQAAADLYGGTTGAAYNTVQKAWDAVGVPGGTSGGSSVTTLSNGQTLSSLSGATGSWTYYKITVPASQTSLKITMSGGTGDADLYVKLGSQPTSTSYTYRPYLSGNNESVSVTNPTAGDWYIGINGYAAYSGVSLNATYSTSGGSTGCTTYSGSLSGTGASAIQPNGTYYQTTVTGTNSGKLTGPASGADFDLYLLKWNGTVAASESSTANETISYSGTAGYYEWKVLSYSGSGSYTLCISHP